MKEMKKTLFSFLFLACVVFSAFFSLVSEVNAAGVCGSAAGRNFPVNHNFSSEPVCASGSYLGGSVQVVTDIYNVSPSIGGSGNQSSGKDNYRWTCYGNSDGIGTACAANMSTSGLCDARGVGNTTGEAAPKNPNNLCAKGIPSTITRTLSGPTAFDYVDRWSCAGWYGGTTASCQSLVAVSGKCGSAAGGTFGDAPTANLCNFTFSPALSSAVSRVGNSWNWRCYGVNTGSDVSCSANATTCLGATPTNATLCAGDDTSLTTNTNRTVVDSCTTGAKCEYTCSAGYYNNGGTCVPYACTGSIPSNASLCSGDDAGLTSNVSRTLVSNLCTSGTKCEYRCASGFHNSGGTCVLNAGCGTSHLDSFTTPPTSGLCSAGIASTVTGINSFDWTCTSGATQVACRASGPTAVNASCGANRTNYSASATSWSSTAPTSFCSAGTLVGGTPAFPSAGGSQTWSCAGLYGGMSASCTATRSTPTPTASISAPDCTISAGNSSCSASVTWSTSNFIDATSVRQNGSEFSTSGSSGGSNRTLAYGSHTFTVHDGSVQRASDTATASCAPGTGWNGSICVAAPGTPTGLSATPSACGTGVVSISWNTVAGADGYDLQVDGAWVSLGGATSYTHSGLSAGSYHTYRVRAWNSGGGAGSPSSSVTVAAPASCVYACTGSIPSNANLCSGDSSSLLSDTGRTLVNSCTSSTKCEYTCAFGYHNNGGVCVQNASCGSSNGGMFNTAPTSGLCSVGTASAVSGSYSWSCANGLTTNYCSASLPTVTNGSCGANRTNYSASATSWSSTAPTSFCSAGTLVGGTPAFPSAGGSQTWSCAGLYGGMSASCTATRSNPAPGTPTGLSAIPSACGTGNISITWNGVTNADGYDLEVDGVWMSLGNVTWYSHTGLAAGSAHTYRVRAWNTAGGAGSPSSSVTVAAPAGCALSDIVAQNSGPSTGTVFASGDTITFSGNALNISPDSISQAGWADVEIDWNSDDSYSNYNAFGGSQLGSFTSGQSKALSYVIPGGFAPVGTHRYRFNVDVTNVLSESNEVNNRSGWVTFIINASPTVSLSASGCVIPVGSGQCTGSVNWNFANISAPENYRVQNVTTGLTIGTTATGNSTPVSLRYGVHRIEATANGVSDNREVNATCILGSAWNPATSQCELLTSRPLLSIAPSPALVRQEQTSEVLITISSPLVMNCTVYSLSSSDITFVHDGTVNQNRTYRYSTNELRSARVVSVTCEYAAGQSVSAEARIEVVPSIEEI